MVIIGLTGGIASGKSTAARILSGLGAVVIDADKVGHEVLRTNADVRRKLIANFGSCILGNDGEIDRGKLGNIVFEDLNALEQLDRIMHPVIRQMVEQKIEAMHGRAVKAVVVEATLLVEAGWADLVDEVWAVIASESTVIERLRTQRGLTEQEARVRIDSQTPIADRARYADVVIKNDSDIDALRGKIEELWVGIDKSNTD